MAVRLEVCMPAHIDIDEDRFRVEALKTILAEELEVAKEDISESYRDIGRGYSVEAIALAFVTALFLGKPIDENIEAWLRIGRRILNVFKRAKSIKPHPPQILINKNVAQAVAIAIAVQEKDQANIVVRAAHDIPVQPESWEADRGQDFSVNTDRLYVFIIQVDGDTHLIALCSNGKVALHEVVPTSNYMDFHSYWS